MHYLIQHNSSKLFSCFDQQPGYTWKAAGFLYNCFYSLEEANELIKEYGMNATPIDFHSAYGAALIAAANQTEINEINAAFKSLSNLI